jgi:hypothetical protein
VSDPRFDELAARAIARRLQDAPAPPPPSDRERAADIDAMVRAVRRRSVWKMVTVGAAASIALGAAAGALLRAGVGAGTSAERQPAVPAPARPSSSGDEARRVRLADGGEVKPGQVLASRERRSVVLSSASGTEVWLEHGSELAVVEAGRVLRFALTRGQAHAQVSPLRPGERFIIATSDAEVEVHGTVFEVSVAPPDVRCRSGVVTRVWVSHGVVEVRSAGRADRVSSGEQWPPECEPAASGEPASAPTVPLRTVARVVARRAAPAPAPAAAAPLTSAPPPTPPPLPSALPEQNDLFAAALSSQRRGQPKQALVYLDRLLSRWPDGPLVEGGMAERMRALGAAGDVPAAARAGREYLLRFPNGFARAEARRLAGGGGDER